MSRWQLGNESYTHFLHIRKGSRLLHMAEETFCPGSELQAFGLTTDFLLELGRTSTGTQARPASHAGSLLFYLNRRYVESIFSPSRLIPVILSSSPFRLIFALKSLPSAAGSRAPTR